MIIANEGKKNLEARANFKEPRGCGCITNVTNVATVRDSFCACGCGGTSAQSSASDAGYNA